MRRLHIVQVFLLPLLALAAINPAQAADEQYIYWSYWSASGSQWQLQKQGSGSETPADGTVQGWRYGIGAAQPGKSQEPGVAPDFTGVCGATPAQTGQKRVAVVIDSNDESVAPSGEAPPGPVAKCAQLPVAANGSQVLAAVASVREADDGMICGINGYPQSGCVRRVSGSTTTASPSASASKSGTPATAEATNWGPFAAGGVLIVLIAIGGFMLARRRGI